MKINISLYHFLIKKSDYKNLIKIMKTCLLFLFAFTFQIMALNTRAQDAAIELKRSTATIGQLINEIEKQTDYLVVYSNREVDTNRKVNFRQNSGKVSSYLNAAFSNTDIGYNFENDYIILSKKAHQNATAIAQLIRDAQQQGRTVQQGTTITGKVTDEQGEPVIGANIVEKGVTANGTITDVDGRFSLNVSPGTTLTVSYIGYTTQEIAVGNRTQLQIVLVEDAKALEEVVVVGYGVQKKRDLTGAVSSVKVAEMPVQVYSTVSHALAGKAAGLQVSQVSAQPGGGTKFRIRGETSTGAGNDPLIIIDGFPISWSTNENPVGMFGYNNGSIDNVLESINPNDIESIEVLKDASATSIYGSRAGHGVIIVTTKRGKNQKANVTYSGNTSVQVMGKSYQMLDAKEFMMQRDRVRYERYLYENGLDVYATYNPKLPGYVAPPFEPLYSVQEIANAATTDWLGEITRTGVQHSHNISMTGGSESTQYLASINYFNQEGVLKTDGLSRFTAKLNLDQRLSRLAKAGLTLNLSRNQYRNAASSGQYYEGVMFSAVQFKPTIPVYDADGNYSRDPERSTVANPVSLLEITDNSTRNRLMGMAYLEAEPVKGLLLKASLGADLRNTKRKTYLPSTTLYGAQANGKAGISENDNIDYLMDLTATWTKEIGSHNFTALAGYSYQQFNNEGFNAGSENFIMDSFLYNNLNMGGSSTNVGSWANKNALGSYFARVNYSFLGRYLLTATVRADGASNFNPEYRWGYFPSVSLGWRFSDEAFMEGFSSWLSNGKFRVSYGQTGNSNVGNRLLDYYGGGVKSGYDFGGSYAIGIKASQLGNPKLRWETTTEMNVGLDLGFLGGRINLAAEYYSRVISDLLAEKNLMSYYEVTRTYANIGKTQGRGVEITLNTVNIQNKDFQWMTDLTWSFYRDRWLERDPEWKPGPHESATDPIRSLFTSVPDGLLQVGEKAPDHQPLLLPGQFKIKDLSGPNGVPDGTLNDYDVVYYGSSDPDFLFGINNTLRYKNLDLNLYFYGAVNQLRGQSYYEAGIGGLEGNAQNVSTIVREQWFHDNQNATNPSVITIGSNGIGGYYVHNISYLRCRNITLGYVLPLPKNILQRARIYADVNNPFVITNWTGADPETDFTVGNSLNTFAYPNVRTFSFGVDITF
jgi:TonB-linked SusC/RagA family outer membrane protein